MKLYVSNRAPNPRRVRWVMAEKDVAHIELVEMDILKGEHRSPDYVSRAGLPQLPALELDDGPTITESVAICRYLESLHPEPNLFGHNAEETAVIEMWTRRAEMLLAMPLMIAVRHGHPAFAALEQQIPELAATSRANAEQTLSFFDARLAESEFIAGDRMTMADIIAFTGLDFARLVRFQPSDDQSHVGQWAAAMRQRPAAAAGV